MTLNAIIVVLAVALLCTGHHAPAPVRVMQSRAVDRVAVQRDGKTDLVAIWSEHGIGNATLALGDGPRPRRLAFRLHLRGLEHFRLQYGKRTLIVTASSGAEPDIHRYELRETSREETPIAAGSPLWMPVQRGVDYFEIEAPADFLTGTDRTLTLHWIDFYRN